MKRTFCIFAAGVIGLATSLASQAETGLSDTAITLGMSLPLSGPSGANGQEIKSVVTAYFDQVNKSGGINGRHVDLVVLDDGYDTDKTVANTKTLINERKVFALLSYYGTTPTTEAMDKVFGPAKVPLVGVVSGAASLRQSPAANPNNRYVFNLRASYAEEAEAVANQMLSIGIKNVAVLYQNDGYGKSGLEGVTAALKKHNLTPVASGTVERNSEDVSKAVDAIAKANPQGVVLITLAKPAAAFIKGLKAKSLAPMFTALSPVAAESLYGDLPGDARGVGISQVMPFPWNDTIPVVRDYQRLLGKQGHYSYFGIEAYISARTMAEALRKAGAKDLSRDKLVSTLESSSLDLGGYRVAFTPNSRNGSHFVEMTVIGAGGKVMR